MLFGGPAFFLCTLVWMLALQVSLPSFLPLRKRSPPPKTNSNQTCPSMMVPKAKILLIRKRNNFTLPEKSTNIRPKGTSLGRFSKFSPDNFRKVLHRTMKKKHIWAKRFVTTLFKSKALTKREKWQEAKGVSGFERNPFYDDDLSPSLESDDGRGSFHDQESFESRSTDLVVAASIEVQQEEDGARLIINGLPFDVMTERDAPTNYTISPTNIVYHCFVPYRFNTTEAGQTHLSTAAPFSSSDALYPCARTRSTSPPPDCTNCAINCCIKVLPAPPYQPDQQKLVFQSLLLIIFLCGFCIIIIIIIVLACCIHRLKREFSKIKQEENYSEISDHCTKQNYTSTYKKYPGQSRSAGHSRSKSYDTKYIKGNRGYRASSTEYRPSDGYTCQYDKSQRGKVKANMEDLWQRFVVKASSNTLVCQQNKAARSQMAHDDRAHKVRHYHKSQRDESPNKANLGSPAKAASVPSSLYHSRRGEEEYVGKEREECYPEDEDEALQKDYSCYPHTTYIDDRAEDTQDILQLYPSIGPVELGKFQKVVDEIPLAKHSKSTDSLKRLYSQQDHYEKLRILATSLARQDSRPMHRSK